jgi:hypothetical protein
VIVGFEGRTIGGGLGTGRLVEERVWRTTVLVGSVEAALCDSGRRSMLIGLEGDRLGADTTPRPISTSRSRRLTAIANATPDARRCSGVRSYGEVRR